MSTSNHTATDIIVAEQTDAHLFEHVVSMQMPAAMGDGLTNAEALLVELLAASPARGRSFALSMHERLCECGDFDHASVWEVMLRLCGHSTPLNDT